MSPAIERVTTVKNSLGEGPLWDANSQQLFWVDSLAGKLFRLDVDERLSEWQLPCMIGSLAVIDDATLLLSMQDGFHFFDLDNEKRTVITDPESDTPETRFNDGKTDRAGNFLTGSMGIKIRDPALGTLYRINERLGIEVLAMDVAVSNGPCFSPDGQTFYFNDGRRRILAYDYSPTGPLSRQRIFFDGNAHDTGSDGATVDADGNLWTALIGSGEVACINPDGQLETRITMPVSLPSSVMFGGPDLDVLYVTSISDSGNRTSDDALAGALFAITGLGVRGIAEPRFNYSSG